MYGFEDCDLAGSGPKFQIWRRGSIMALELVGRITDDDAARWRGAFMEVSEAHGRPRFIVIDATQFDSQTSLRDRYRTVEMARRLMSSVERSAIYVGTSIGSPFVIKTILRVLTSMPCDLYVDVGQFRDAVDAMKREAVKRCAALVALLAAGALAVRARAAGRRDRKSTRQDRRVVHGLLDARGVGFLAE
jgi:hypothetical protein